MDATGKPGPILQVRGLVKRFGGLTAVKNLSLDLRASPYMAAVARHLAAAFDELQQGIACRAVHGVDQRLSRWLLERQEGWAARRRRLPTPALHPGSACSAPASPKRCNGCRVAA